MIAFRSVELVRKPRIDMSKAVAPARWIPVMYLYKSDTFVDSTACMKDSV